MDTVIDMKLPSLLCILSTLALFGALSIGCQSTGDRPALTTQAEPLDESFYGWLTNSRTREAYPLLGSHAAAKLRVRVSGDPTGQTYPAYTDATMPRID